MHYSEQRADRCVRNPLCSPGCDVQREVVAFAHCARFIFGGRFTLILGKINGFIVYN
jgi:hypothetical protein|eukprot:COSAG01_NODE_6556_length_3610_cov_26.538023_4_plen_57_part_00